MPAEPGRAQILRDEAVEQMRLGRPRRARQLLLRASRILDECEPSRDIAALRSRVWISLALIDADLHGVEAGLRAAENARASAYEAQEPSLIVPAVGQLGLIALRAGMLQRALDAFASIEDRLDAVPPEDQVAVLLNTATVRMYLGTFHAVRPVLLRAAEVARRGNVDLGEFMATHNLGYLDFLRGDLPRALAELRNAESLGPAEPMGVALLDRARVLLEAGLSRDADAVLARAAAILSRDRLAQDLGEVEVERARCAIVSDDPAAARRFAGRARTRFARRGSDRWRQNAELVLLQADLAAGRPGGRLVGPARRLRDELAAEGLDMLSRTASLIAVEASLAAGDVPTAESEMRLLGRGSRRDPITYRLHATYVRAQLDAASGRRAPAVARLRRGLNDLAAYQASFGSLELSTAAAVHGRRLVGLDLELAIASGGVPTIFAAAERGRAVTSRLTPVRPPDDAVTAELLAELRQTVEALRGAALDAQRTAPLAKRRGELETQIAQRAWSRPGAHMVTASAGLDEVQAALADRSLAEYVVSGADLGAIVITAQSAAYVPLGSIAPVRELIRRVRADLDVLAQPRLPAAIAAAVRVSFDHTVAALDDQLIRPLGVSGRLVLVTTGLLGQLPWGTLPSLRGVPLVVAPSASAWLAASQRDARRGGARVVSIAGPGLERAEEEAVEVAARWGSTRALVGARASGAAVAKAMSSARVVHIAAHGVHQNENPLFSSIRLADGPLFAHELDQAAGTPEHVVLSACELGLATVRPGDEALGLTSVLLRLGTRSVVAGVARIGDDLAAETMSAYHRLVCAGHSSADALAQATAASTQPVPIVAFGAEWTLRSRR